MLFKGQHVVQGSTVHLSKFFKPNTEDLCSSLCINYISMLKNLRESFSILSSSKFPELRLSAQMWSHVHPGTSPQPGEGTNLVIQA